MCYLLERAAVVRSGLTHAVPSVTDDNVVQGSVGAAEPRKSDSDNHVPGWRFFFSKVKSIESIGRSLFAEAGSLIQVVICT